MEKTKFDEALTVFNNEVRKAAEEVRRRMTRIGLESIKVEGKPYRVVQARYKGYQKSYLAVVVGKLHEDVKSLEESLSNNFVYCNDAQWIEAATTDEKISFMKDLKRLLKAVDNVEEIRIAEMESAVMAAENALNNLPELPVAAGELPGFEGTMEAVGSLIDLSRKAAGIEEKGGAR